MALFSRIPKLDRVRPRTRKIENTAYARMHAVMVTPMLQPVFRKT
jgi:hypothetical protein